MHQTGWTGLVANLVLRRYRNDIPAFWKVRTREANETRVTANAARVKKQRSESASAVE